MSRALSYRPLFRALMMAIAAATLLVPSRAVAQGNLKWGPAPAVLPPGARIAVVSGDPYSSGPYVVQLAMPSDYRIPPHTHPTAEHLRVVSGTFIVGPGTMVDMSNAKRYMAGDTLTAMPNMAHWAMTSGPTTVEISGTGPFEINYANPSDMPKPMKPKH